MKKAYVWVHGLGLCALLFFVGKITEYLALETLIVFILMYEIGFDIPVMKKLMDINYDAIAWLKDFFNPSKRGKRRGKIKRRRDSDTQGI